MSQPSSGRNDQGEEQPQRREQRFQKPAPHGAQRESATPAPKSKTPWIVAGLGVAVAAAAIGYSVWGGGKASIPATVLGQPQDVAEAQIRSAGFQVAAKPTYQEDASKPDGVVLDTIPKPGTKLKAGQEVTLVLNQTKSAVSPLAAAGVIGEPRATAEAAIRAAGYTVSPTPTFRTDTSQPDGAVLDTIPKPGTELQPGQELTLVLNQNKSATEPPVETVIIPPVTPGTTYAAYQSQLQALGLKCQPEPYPNPSHVITDANPRPGTKVNKGDLVTMIFSSTQPADPVAKVTVPNLVGEEIAVAEARLGGLSLKSSRFPEKAQDTDEVTKQFPVAGTMVDKDYTVALVGKITPTETDPVMPDIVGKPWTAAQAELAAKGFAAPDYTVTKNSVFKTTTTPSWDQVISSNPPKGVKVPKGTPIQLEVNDDYAVTPPDLANTEFDPATKTKLEAAGFLVPQIPTTPQSMIKMVKVGTDQARGGDKFKRGSELTLTFATTSVADTIPSPIGKSEEDAKSLIATRIAALSSTVKVKVTYKPVTDEAARGKVVSVTKGGVAKIAAGVPLNLKDPGDIELTVEKNPTKWKINPTMAKPGVGGAFTLIPFNGGIRVTSKINGKADSAKDVSTGNLAIDTDDVPIPGFAEIAVPPADYVASELTFAVEVNFKDLGGDTLTGSVDLMTDGPTNVPAQDTMSGKSIKIVFDAPEPVYP